MKKDLTWVLFVYLEVITFLLRDARFIDSKNLFQEACNAALKKYGVGSCGLHIYIYFYILHISLQRDMCKYIYGKDDTFGVVEHGKIIKSDNAYLHILS